VISSLGFKNGKNAQGKKIRNQTLTKANARVACFLSVNLSIGQCNTISNHVMALS